LDPLGIPETEPSALGLAGESVGKVSSEEPVDTTEVVSDSPIRTEPMWFPERYENTRNLQTLALIELVKEKLMRKSLSKKFLEEALSLNRLRMNDGPLFRIRMGAEGIVVKTEPGFGMNIPYDLIIDKFVQRTFMCEEIDARLIEADIGISSFALKERGFKDIVLRNHDLLTTKHPYRIPCTDISKDEIWIEAVNNDTTIHFIEMLMWYFHMFLCIDHTSRLVKELLAIVACDPARYQNLIQPVNNPLVINKGISVDRSVEYLEETDMSVAYKHQMMRCFNDITMRTNWFVGDVSVGSPYLVCWQQMKSCRLSNEELISILENRTRAPEVTNSAGVNPYVINP
jgi:hypothetical protein